MRNWISITPYGLLLVIACTAAPSPANANPSMTAIAVSIATLSGYAAIHQDQVLSGEDAYAYSFGAFDRVDRVAQTWNLGVERRWGKFFVWRLTPFVGADITGRQSVYYFGGLRFGLQLTPHFIVEPSFALAHYFHGGGKDLGSPVNFRSGLDAEWRLTNGMRLGIAYHHMSHWILFGPHNPGTEILTLTLTVPLH